MRSLLVTPGSRVHLEDYDPDDTGPYSSVDAAAAQLVEDRERLARLQQRLYAERRRALVVVLQAMDAGGKDGTIKHLCSGVNPTGCQVTSFKPPAGDEAEHDFLWRVYRALPRWGNLGIFNRSHYEEVLIVRVHSTAPKAHWQLRYDQINRFERLVSELGTRVLKFYLHIDKDEQRRRLHRRLVDKEKCWKLAPEDLVERAHWDEYQVAYEDALSECSTEWAPWYIVPANHKWYRNLVVTSTVVEALEQMDPRPREPCLDAATVHIE